LKFLSADLTDGVGLTRSAVFVFGDSRELTRTQGFGDGERDIYARAIAANPGPIEAPMSRGKPVAPACREAESAGRDKDEHKIGEIEMANLALRGVRKSDGLVLNAFLKTIT
jgi:hypothetical protein